MEEEKELKDIKLGSSFAYEGVIYECRPAYTCEGCIFNPGDDCYGCCKPKFFGHCSALNRVDNRDVIFVEIGKEKPAVPKTEFAVGEEFQYGLKTLRCVAVENRVDICNGCVLKPTIPNVECCDCRFTGSCDGNEREDATDVIFVEVKPENEQK